MHTNNFATVKTIFPENFEFKSTRPPLLENPADLSERGQIFRTS